MSWRDFYEDRYQSKSSGHLIRSDALRAAEHRRIDVALTHSGISDSSGIILDCGSGASRYLADVQNVIAVDIAGESLRTCGRSLRVQADLEVLPFQTESVRAIVCSQVLEHVPDWRAALGELHRVLMPGGRIFIAVPNRYSLMRRRYHSVQRKIDMSGHIHEFREAELLFALADTGFEVLSSRGACFDVFWVGSKLERGKSARLWVSALERVGSDALFLLMELESRLRQGRLTGMSLEVVAAKAA